MPSAPPHSPPDRPAPRWPRPERGRPVAHSEPPSARRRILRSSPAAGLLTIALAALQLPPTALHAQDSDSAQLLEDMHELQEDFERYRESRTLIDEQERPSGVCDERIGRICIWFGGQEEEDIPAELREVGQARVELIRQLEDAFEQIHDRWVLGQLVHYLVENRNVDRAVIVADQCGIAETWWCHALRGYALHVYTRYTEAEAAFRDALAAMPDSVYDEWMTPRYILTEEGVEAFRALSPEERERQWELLWRLSDPLFLFEGNDRFTDHYARWVVALNRRDAADPMNIEWEEDLEESLIRYGRNTGYSRVHDPTRMFSGGGLQDTRRMVGHHHPQSRGYLFPERFLESPSDIPPESWITAPREARTWHAPLYAPDVRGLETQVGRFRRDDRMLVVGAYRPTVPDVEGEGVVPAWSAEGGIEGEPHAALFLVPLTDEPNVVVQGSEPEGVLTVEATPGEYVSSLEVVDLEGRRAWRARQGVVQRPLVPGQVDVSDLMILRAGAPLPASLEEAIPHVRPGVRLRVGERFAVVWEAYGLGILEPVQVTIGFTGGRPGFLERVGDFLGVIEPEQPVDITFEDVGPDRVQEVFRAVEIQLPDLDPGEYTLHLQLELTGRTPLVTSRPVIVVE